MRLAWWGVIAIGIVLLGAGAYAIVVSQNSIDYIKSCGTTVVACGPGVNPKPALYLTDPLVASLQQAQLVWAAGAALVGAGLVGIAYGVFLRPGKPEQTIPAV